MDSVVPSLSAEGWVEDPRKMLDRLLSHAYCSDFSQTFLFTNEVSSVAKLVKENQGKLSNAKSDLQRMWEAYLGRYFDDVQIHVYIIENDSVLQGELATSGIVTDRRTREVLQFNEAATRNGSVFRSVLEYIEQGGFNE